MILSPNIKIADLALLVDSALIIADVHIGYEEALNKQGILVPRLQFDEIVKRMHSIFSALKYKKIDKIIVNGDLKHEFGAISEQEWRNTLKFIDILAKHCNEVILIKGNHDAILGPIAKKRNVRVIEHYIIKTIDKRSLEKNTILKKTKYTTKDNILIIHGNQVPSKELLKEVSTVIIGHEHPAISLKEGARVEQFKCFLKGKYKGKDLIVQPSFNTIVEGTDLLRDQILSPLLKQNLDNFDVYIVEDKVYHFGKFKNLKR